MKKLLLFLSVLFTLTVNAQTATNFIAHDCNGNLHNLYDELDSGRVIIMIWVMPCGGCVYACQAATAIASNYAVTDSGRVCVYIADDYANASCQTLSSWMTTNNIPHVTSFSDSAVSMSPYGVDGMPKVVVFGGGSSHGVYFNQDNQYAGDSIGIVNAVDSALAAASGVPVIANEYVPTTVYPNPATGTATLNFYSASSETITIDITAVNGQVARSMKQGVQAGPAEIPLDLAGLAAGSYIIRIHSARGIETVTLDVLSAK